MDNICLPNDWDNLNFTYLVPPNQGKDWVYAFPGVGISVGFIDFIVSIACLIIICTVKRKVRLTLLVLRLCCCASLLCCHLGGNKRVLNFLYGSGSFLTVVIGCFPVGTGKQWLYYVFYFRIIFLLGYH